MPVIVVVGGQYGSEGKGKLVARLSLDRDPSIVVRCGGPNAGHSFDYLGRHYSLRQAPSGLINPNCQLRLAAGSVVHPEILLEEIKRHGLEQRLKVDADAITVAPEDLASEANSGLRERVSSTLSGTGSATSRKVMRASSVLLASQVGSLRSYASDVTTEINDAIDRDELVIVEGTQGAGLSLHHSRLYPHTTSRDTSAAAFLSEAGISSRVPHEVVMVVRTFPIRVAGSAAGPLPAEIDWGEIRARSGCPRSICEYTTVTKLPRRVAEFDDGVFRLGIRLNRPDCIALHGADYLNFADFGVRDYDALSAETKSFVRMIEATGGTRVRYIFTGPDVEHTVDRGEE